MAAPANSQATTISAPSERIRGDEAHHATKRLMEQQFGSLGPRERQVVKLLLQGCDNAEVALELKMAHGTMKAHFESVISPLPNQQGNISANERCGNGLSVESTEY